MTDARPGLGLDALLCGELVEAATLEAYATLRATATASAVRYGTSSAALFDRDGRCLAVTVSDGLLLGAARRAPPALIDAVAFAFDDGDAVLSNHPDAAGVAPTLLTLVAPAFLEAEYVGAVAVQLRVDDLGGDVPGGWNPSAREWLAEGIAVSPVKLVRAGRPALDVWDMLRLNSRQPADLGWDLEAMLGACRQGLARLRRLAARWGPARFAALGEEYLAYSQSRMRRQLAPRERRAAEGEATAGAPGGAVAVRVVARLDEPGLVLDFGGSDAIRDLALPRAATEGAALLAVLSGLADRLPINDGSLGCVEVLTRPGTAVAAPAGAATSFGHSLLAPAVGRAAATALARLGIASEAAGWRRAPRVVVFSPPPGSRTRLPSGQPMLPDPLAAAPMPSAEELERDAGIRVLRRERLDNGGGVDVVVANVGAEARLCALGGGGSIEVRGGAASGRGWEAWPVGAELALRGERTDA